MTGLLSKRFDRCGCMPWTLQVEPIAMMVSRICNASLIGVWDSAVDQQPALVQQVVPESLVLLQLVMVLMCSTFTAACKRRLAFDAGWNLAAFAPCHS
jgi:hypothetical protein